MLIEQVLRIISGVFVGIYIARYLGPDDYGILSYVIAISAITIAVSRLGMDAVLVRELVRTPKAYQKLMGTAFWLMAFTAIICYVLTWLAMLLTDEAGEVKLYALIATASAGLTSFLTIDFYFQSKLKSKYSTLCKVFVLSTMSCAKLTLIWTNAELKWFVIASLFDHLILAAALIVAMAKNSSLNFINKFDLNLSLKLLKSAWPMVLAAIATMILMRIDQLMIRNMLDMKQLGVYSAAIRIYEAWIIFPYLLTISLLPAIVKLKTGNKKNYHLRLTQLFRLLIWISIVAAILVSTLSNQLITLAFGIEFEKAAPVLNIVMWAGIFASIGSLSARYYNVEHMEKKILSRTFAAATINVIANLFMIPTHGIEGAAAATLIAVFFANYLMDWFDQDLKELLKIKNDAIFRNPFRQIKP